MWVGIDVGGTKIDVCILDDVFNPVQVTSFPRPNSYNELLAEIVKVLENRPIIQFVRHLGLGVPGILSPQGSLTAINQIPYLLGKSPAHDLSRLLGSNVVIANHLQCFALSELTAGHDVSRGLSVCLILGTGTGAELIIDGKLYLGANRLAGELGSSYAIGSSSNSVIETFTTGRRLEQLFDVNQYHSEATFDAQFLKMDYSDYLNDLSMLLTNIFYWLDPSMLILGGGVSAIPGMIDLLRSEVERRLFRRPTDSLIVPAKFGASSGARGAALLPSVNPNALLLKERGAAIAVAAGQRD